MKKLFTKITCVVLIISMLFTFSAVANDFIEYTYNSYSDMDNVTLNKSGNKIYLIGINNNTVSIDAVYPTQYNISLTLSQSPYTYNLFSDNLVLVSPDYYENSTYITIYNIKNDVFNSFYIDCRINEKYSFAFCQNHLFYIDDMQNICEVTNKGKFVKKYDSDIDFTSLSCDYYGNIYATTNYGLYKQKGNSFSCISSGTYFKGIQFFDDNYFIDSGGYVYEMKSNVVSKANSYQSTAMYSSAGICNDYLIISKNKTLSAIDKNTQLERKYKNLSNFIEQVCVIDDTIVVMSYNKNCPVVSFFKLSDFADINTNNYSDNSNTDNDNQSNAEVVSQITSNVYIIDNTRYKILEIPNNTTVAQFKKNMNYQGYSVEFIRNDGKVIKSGNVGTATIARFYNDYESYEFELSVLGDLTGEGNMNSRDKQLMFDHILERITFDGVYYESANLHKENPRISIADLVVMLRMISKQKNER